jgi:exopolysaccharide biosynthesis polyprenyl glycosylphosphotransferase
MSAESTPTSAIADGARPTRRVSRSRMAGAVRRAGLGSEAIQEAAAPRPDIATRERLYRRMLAYSDVGSAALALLLSVSVLGDDHVHTATLLALPLVVAIGKLQGLYDRDELVIRKSTMDEAPQLFQLTTLYTLLIWLFGGLLIEGSLSRPQLVVLWATLFTAGLLGRQTARRLARQATPTERILFVGDAGAYTRVQAKLDCGQLDAVLVGRLSMQRTGRHVVERSTSTQDLAELIRWTDAHRVLIEPQTLPPQEMLDFVRAAKAVGVRVSLLPHVLDVVGSSVVFDDLHGLTVLGVRRFGLTRSSHLIKRSFDLVGAAVALVLTAPLLAVIAIAIKLDSRGPVLFRQTRVGRGGRHFRICKFRTMTADAETKKAQLWSQNEASGGLFKITNDPRVTRVGRLLRRTSLDELPQLFNVLAGDMSLVGPRPLVIDEDDRITGWDRRRLHLTPGMTGPWQVLGPTRVPLTEMVKIDYLYVSSWSLWADVKIMLRTVRYMLARRGV